MLASSPSGIESPRTTVSARLSRECKAKRPTDVRWPREKCIPAQAVSALGCFPIMATTTIFVLGHRGAANGSRGPSRRASNAPLLGTEIERRRGDDQNTVARRHVSRTGKGGTPDVTGKAVLGRQAPAAVGIGTRRTFGVDACL
ncbi:MAG: hypothetical protein V2A73_08940 [Pseudomonadota bacterium]